MHVVLVNPEIAGNTGNIIRLCANTGAVLHLVEPLGFSMESALLRRAGLDYHDLANVLVHATIDDCLHSLDEAGSARRYTLSSKATDAYTNVAYDAHDVLVFGAEGSGLSDEQIGRWQPATALYIPMQPHNRSLNLANAVAIVVYEAWRQAQFAGAADPSQRSGALTSESFTEAPFDR